LSYAIVLIVIVPLLVVNCLWAECKTIEKSQLIGGVFALLALPITFWQLTQHMVHYTKPYLQKHVIRILWMVPIYALDAWLGLIYPQLSIYMNSMRECYEAYVIYNFMKFLLNYLNAEMDLEANLEMKAQVGHIFPLCCLRNWEMGREFVHNCKHGILQYTVVRPITTALAFILEMAGVYGDDEYRADVAFPYIIVVNNFSQFVAMYCLVLFYKANKDELKPMSPLGKFLCIKSVVFFSFFQGVAISILVNTGVVWNIFGTTEKDNDSKAVSSSLQNFLICIEMFFAAIAHHYAFSYRAYVDMAAEQPNCCESFLQMWDVSDVKQDFQEHMGVVRSTVRNVMPSKVYRHPGGKGEERAHLLSISDGVDYNSSGAPDEGVSTANLPRPIQAARSASLQLVAEMNSNAPSNSNGEPVPTTSTAAKLAQPISTVNADIDNQPFTDLTDYDKED
jgi:ABC-type Fe3+-siderophore transport system permease subunit